MNLREALIVQGPSLALQRAAADEIARLDAVVFRAYSDAKQAWIEANPEATAEQIEEAAQQLAARMGL